MRRQTYRTTITALAIAALLTFGGALGMGCGDGGGGDNDNGDNAPATCGNGSVDTGERCDDGNRQNGDGCSSNCLEECGDDVCSVGEFCCAVGDARDCLPFGAGCVQ